MTKSSWDLSCNTNTEVMQDMHNKCQVQAGLTGVHTSLCSFDPNAKPKIKHEAYVAHSLCSGGYCSVFGKQKGLSEASSSRQVCLPYVGVQLG